MKKTSTLHQLHAAQRRFWSLTHSFMQRRLLYPDLRDYTTVHLHNLKIKFQFKLRKFYITYPVSR